MRLSEGALRESGAGFLVQEDLVPRGGGGRSPHLGRGGVASERPELEEGAAPGRCVPFPSPTDPHTFLPSPGPQYQDAPAKFAVGACPVLRAPGLQS